VRFAAIDAEKANYPVSLMCRVLEVTRSGYYAWRERPPSKHAELDVELRVVVAAAHDESGGIYGAPRVWESLKKTGQRTSRKRVARLMREQGLAGRKKRRFCVTTDSQHSLETAPNILQRRFDPNAPNTAWAADITYLPTHEGWLYLAIVLDLWSRRIVGWSMSQSIDTELALSALGMAMDTRRPAPGLVHHSDRGTQYAATDYRQALDDNGVICSMSRRANCWDNAVAESFFGTLKVELVGDRTFRSRMETRQAVFKYIEGFYNSRRLHSSLGYRSPAEFEKLYWAA
jgi:transposase InsO family protein